MRPNSNIPRGTKTLGLRPQVPDSAPGWKLNKQNKTKNTKTEKLKWIRKAITRKHKPRKLSWRNAWMRH